MSNPYSSKYYSNILLTSLAMTCLANEGKCPVIYGVYAEISGCLHCPFHELACDVDGVDNKILEVRRANRINLSNKILRMKKLQEILT